MPKAEKDADTMGFAARLIALLGSTGQGRRGAGAYLARKYGVATVTANAWLNGDHKASIEHTRRIAEDHGGTFEELYFGKPQHPRTELAADARATATATATLGEAQGEASNLRPAGALRGRVPVISAVQAGHFTDAVDNYAPGDADEWIDVGVPVKRHTFALVVEGDSMEPEFTEGMRVVVEPDMTPEIGDYVVAGNGEQATLKKLVRDGNDLYLKPLNPRYPIKPLGDARIIGVVREAHRKYR